MFYGKIKEHKNDLYNYGASYSEYLEMWTSGHTRTHTHLKYWVIWALHGGWAQVRSGSVSAAWRHHGDDHLRQHGARLQPTGARLPRVASLRGRKEDCHQLTRTCPVLYPNNWTAVWCPPKCPSALPSVSFTSTSDGNTLSNHPVMFQLSTTGLLKSLHISSVSQYI